MTVWNGQAAKLALRNASAKGLLKAALFFQAQHQQRLAKSNPRPYVTPSQPGEYPRARTGAGRAGVMVDPPSVEAIAREGRVRIGYVQNVFYMLVLELGHNRLGLLQTLKDLKGQLKAIIEAG